MQVCIVDIQAINQNHQYPTGNFLGKRAFQVGHYDKIHRRWRCCRKRRGEDVDWSGEEGSLSEPGSEAPASEKSSRDPTAGPF